MFYAPSRAASGGRLRSGRAKADKGMYVNPIEFLELEDGPMGAYALPPQYSQVCAPSKRLRPHVGHKRGLSRRLNRPPNLMAIVTKKMPTATKERIRPAD